MENTSIEKIWPGWEIAGELGEGVFGKEYLIRSQFDGDYVYAAAKVIKMPPSDEALTGARASNVSDEALRMYFGKFKNDLSWELAMYKSVACPALADVDSFVVRENDENAGWTGYMRTALYTPLKKYYEKEDSGAEDAECLGKELCAALERCESFGIRHGDIKPENVMVTDGGAFVLSDLGIRRCLEKAGSGIFNVPVTPYDAPELDESRKYTPASDIYSLGMVMRFVANGCTLDAEKLLPAGLEEVIATATAANPEDRYHSAAAMKAALLAMGGESRLPRRATAAALAMDTAKSVTPAAKKKAATVKKAKTAKIAGGTDDKKEKTIITVGIIVALILILAIMAVGFGWFNKEAPAEDEGAKQEQTVPYTKPEDKTVTVPEDKTEPEVTPEPGETEKTEPEQQPEQEPEQTPEQKPEEETKPEAKPREETKPKEETKPEETKPEQETEPEQEDVPKTRNSYYRDDSDKVMLTEEDLEGVSRSDAAMMINEIYARHGRTFKTESIQKYFDSQQWYTRSSRSDSELESEMNDVERANIRTLSAYKKSLG